MTQFLKIYNSRPEVSDADKKVAAEFVDAKFAEYSRNLCNEPIQTAMSRLSHRQMAALFWGADQCNCCVRHRSNALIDFTTNEVSEIVCGVSRECDCHCRQTKRFIRRAYILSDEIPSDLPDLVSDTE